MPELLEMKGIENKVRRDYNRDERVDICVWYVVKERDIVVKVKVEKKVLIESSGTYLCHDDAIGNIANYG